MSVSVNFQGQPQPPKRTALTTSEADIFTPKTSDATYQITGIRIANIDHSTAAYCTLYLRTSGGVNQVFYNQDVAADTSVFIEDPILVASSKQPYASLQGLAEANSRIVVTVFSVVLPK